MSRERKVIVANAWTDTPAATTPITTAGTLSIIMRTPAGAMAAMADAMSPALYPTMMICVGKGTGYAPDIFEIKGKDFITGSSTAYAAGTQKVVKVGYPDTGTNQLAVNLYSDYEYAIRVMPTDVNNESVKWEPAGQYFTHISAYNTPSAAHGRYNLLKTLVDQINDQYWDDNNSLNVICDLYHSETLVAGTGADCVVVNESTTVGCTTTAGPSVGDFLSLKGRLYKITAITLNTSFTIDRPYAGTSETITAGTTWATEVGYIASATVDENTYFGIWFTGDVDQDFTVSFEQGFDGGENDTITISTAMVYSKGTYAEVVQEEKWTDPSFGLTEKTGVKPLTRVTNASASNTYDKWNFIVKDPQSSNMGQTHDMEKELVLYLKSDQTTTHLADYLNNYFGDSTGASPFSAV